MAQRVEPAEWGGFVNAFQRPVDLITTQSMKNPVFRHTVNSTSQALYAA